MVVEKKSVAFTEEVYNLVQNRVGEMNTRSEIVNQGLKRYYKIIFCAQMEIFEKFTNKELEIIFSACDGATFANMLPHLIYREVLEADKIGQLKLRLYKEALDDERYKKMLLDHIEGYDIDVLLQKLLDLNELEQVAMVELVERFWVEVGKGRIKLDAGEFINEEIELFRDNLKYA